MTAAGADAELGDRAPSTVVFDVGEVLIDETRVWTIWADLVGVSPATFGAVLGAAIVQGESVAAVFDHLARNLEWQDLEEQHEARYGGFVDQDLYPDVRACLEELATEGFSIVIAGNQPARRRSQLEALSLPHDAMAMSEELGVAKPDPVFFDRVFELTGAAARGDLLYVGDRTDNDVAPAAAAGLRTCWLRRGPWGQLQDLPDGVQEPDLVLEGLGELPTLLTTWRGGTQ